MNDIYSLALEKLKESGFEILEGVTDEQLVAAEEVFGIYFPKALKDFYKQGMPVGHRFPNWTDLSEENVAQLKKKIAFPEMSVRNENEDNFPEDAVPLIPVYGHKYMALIPFMEDSPVISVYGLDIILCGRNLENFLEIQFLGKDSDSIWDDSVAIIPGWDTLMS